MCNFMVCVLLELRSSSRLPKGNAGSAKAANELVSLKMWLKWNVLKRNEVKVTGSQLSPGPGPGPNLSGKAKGAKHRKTKSER